MNDSGIWIRGFVVASLALTLGAHAGCDGGEQADAQCKDEVAGKADDGSAAPGDHDPGRNDDIADAVTPGLDLLARVEEDAMLEELFLSSRVDEAETLQRIEQALDQNDATSVRIKGEGIPLFTDGSALRLGPAMSGIARLLWSGKVFTFRRNDSGGFDATLENAITFAQIIEADVEIETLAAAMLERGEAHPDGSLPAAGADGSPVTVDEHPSVVLDYADTQLGFFGGLIDEIRPVTSEALAEAGIEADPDLPVDNLWIGRATSRLGFFNRTREFALYFALDFDLQSLEVVSDE